MGGAAGVLDARFREALAKASVLDLIDSLPDGLDTQVGELGDRLSEGERQRIGLARVFLRNADLVLFDEPTSRLDALNEAIILRSIHELPRASRMRIRGAARLWCWSLTVNPPCALPMRCSICNCL